MNATDDDKLLTEFSRVVEAYRQGVIESYPENQDSEQAKVLSGRIREFFEKNPNKVYLLLNKLGAVLSMPVDKGDSDDLNYQLFRESQMLQKVFW